MPKPFVAVACGSASLTWSRMPVQSRSSFQPKNGLIQPSGTVVAIISGDTFYIAMTPMIATSTVRIVNCITSVITTLTMPPLIA